MTRQQEFSTGHPSNMATRDHHRPWRRRSKSRTTMLLVLCVASIAALCIQLSNGASPDAITHLYPEQSLDFQKHLCGDEQLYYVHDLDPELVYDLKISYPASLPTTFTVDVQQVLLSSTTTALDGDIIRKVPRRMLNTEKLRLIPLELLQKWKPMSSVLSGVIGEAQLQKDEKFRFDKLPGNSHTTSESPSTGSTPKPSLLKQGDFIVVVKVRGDVEGVSPVHDLTQRVCVYNIVVEEMLLAAFPRDTLILIVWLVVLLALTLRIVVPYVVSLVALEQPADQELSEQFASVIHTKTS